MNYLLAFEKKQRSKTSAIEFLEKHSISYEYVDLRHITSELFYIMLQHSQLGLDGLVQKRCLEKLQELPLSAAVNLIVKNPNLFLKELYLFSEDERGVRLFVGFKEDDYRSLIAKQRRKIMLELAKESEFNLLG